jgi:hypothetical protein
MSTATRARNFVSLVSYLDLTPGQYVEIAVNILNTGKSIMGTVEYVTADGVKFVGHGFIPCGAGRRFVVIPSTHPDYPVA